MRKAILLTILTIIVLSSSLFASRDRGAVLFLMIGPGARATGMGEAFVAISDDPTATYWNPSGLGLYPLSSEWKSYRLPIDNEIIGIGTVQPRRLRIGGRKPQLWAATSDELWRLRGNEWIDYEIYVTAPEERIEDIVRSYISTTMTTEEGAFESLVEKVVQYNDLTGKTDGFLPPDLRIKIPFRFLIDTRITALEGIGDNLLIGTEKGLFTRRDGRWEKITATAGPQDNKINFIISDDQDNYALGTDAGLFLNRFGRWSKYNTSLGLTSNRVKSASMHGVAQLWVGTDLGASKLGTRTFEKSYTVELPEDTIHTWEGIAREYFDIKSKTKIEYMVSALRVSNDALSDTQVPRKRISVDYDPIFESAVTAIHPDKDGIWFGTEYGVKFFNNSTKKWTNFGWREFLVEEEATFLEIVNQRWPDLTGQQAEDFAESIRRYNLSNQTRVPAGTVIEIPANPASGRVATINNSPDGNIFVGTEYGLLVYNRSKDAFTFFDQQGMGNKEVRNIIDLKDRFVFNAGEEVNWYSRGSRGLTFMHVQWLPQLTSDMYYEFLSGTYFIEGWGTVGASLTYMYMGTSEYRTEGGELRGEFSSYEIALGLSYGTTILPNLAGGLSFKLIHSSLARGILVGNEIKDGTATTFGVDLGLSYHPPVEGLRFGLNVQNLGPNVIYIDEAQSDPLPRNIKLGMAYTIFENEYNRVLFGADINKGIIRNFLDSSERNPWWMEWHHAVKNFGLEYTYADFLSFRGGYILDYDYIPKDIPDEEELRKEDWKSVNYFTLGVGVQYDTWSFDFGYIPEQKTAGEGTLPLSNIMRFSISARF